MSREVPLRHNTRTIDAVPKEKKTLRVAGYCRISTDIENQELSLENQINHCRSAIESNPDWVLAGVYAEKGISGTEADTRPELQRMIRDCEAGLIDMVICKSISRFARNTADCLSMVRKLTSLGVVLHFEKENIQTDRMDSEFLLGILAAFAQDESRSFSSNMKWGIRKRFEAGTYIVSKRPYGYRRGSDGYTIHPGEAEIVRRIYHSAADGESAYSIARKLNEEGVPTWTKTNLGRETRWTSAAVLDIVRNPFYQGDMLYQKTFMDDQYVHRDNKGEVDQYLIESDHPAIVDRERFFLANQTIGCRKGPARSCFSGRIVCAACGKTMHRKGFGKRPYFSCTSCTGMNLYVEDIENAFATVLNKLYFAEKNGIPILADFPGLREAVLNRGIRERYEDTRVFDEFVETVTVEKQFLVIHFNNGLTLREELTRVKSA